MERRELPTLLQLAGLLRTMPQLFALHPITPDLEPARREGKAGNVEASSFHGADRDRDASTFGAIFQAKPALSISTSSSAPAISTGKGGRSRSRPRRRRDLDQLPGLELEPASISLQNSSPLDFEGSRPGAGRRRDLF